MTPRSLPSLGNDTDVDEGELMSADALAAGSTVRPGTEEAWRDGKRYLWLVGLVVPSLAFVASTGFTFTGWTVWLWIGPILILVIVPLLDLLVGIDPTNPPDEVIEALEKDRYYRRIVMAYLPIQYLGLAAAMYLIARGNPGPAVVDALGPVGESAKGWLPAAVLEPFTLTTWQMVATAISIGCIGGIGINTAHELGHKREKVERWLSKIALAQSGYGHDADEHLAGVGDDVAVAECPGCGYRYEVEAGDEHEGFAAGTPWSQIPDDWSCPDCGVRDKVDFRVLADDLPAPDAAQP